MSTAAFLLTQNSLFMLMQCSHLASRCRHWTKRSETLDLLSTDAFSSTQRLRKLPSLHHSTAERPGRHWEDWGEWEAVGGGGAYLRVAPEEAVRDGDVDVEGQRLQDAGLHGDELLPGVGVIADIQEVLHAGWAALLRDRGQDRP